VRSACREFGDGRRVRGFHGCLKFLCGKIGHAEGVFALALRKTGLIGG